jgi:hypothetical protein
MMQNDPQLEELNLSNYQLQVEHIEPIISTSLRHFAYFRCFKGKHSHQEIESFKK